MIWKSVQKSEMNTDRYERLIYACQNLSLFPLLKPEEIQAFRVDYGSRTLARLKQTTLASQPDGKIIFTGHRGCGKSTLLAQFCQEMRERKLFVVFFSIANLSKDS